MADVTVPASNDLPKTAFARGNFGSDLQDAETGCKTSVAEAWAEPILKGQKASRQHLALIDSYTLSHECIRDSLSQLRGRPTIASFFSIEECVLAQGADFSLIIVYLHGLQPPLLQDLPRLRTAFDRSSLFLITDVDHDTHPQFFDAAIEVGARGFVSTKTAGISLALSAIDFVQAGGFFAPLDPLPGARPIASRRDTAAPAPIPLTVREKSVMALLRQGKSNKMIARELALSSNTVKVHIHNILRKMSVANRLEAIAKAP
jgi:DNA-binding NarL/FixJ family response regulator